MRRAKDTPAKAVKGLKKLTTSKAGEASSVSFITINHSLALHKLSYMQQNTLLCPSRMFVRLMKEIGMVMAVEVMGRIYHATGKKDIDGINGNVIIGNSILEAKKPVIVPILRSGLIMAEGMQEIIATTFTGHIGIYHDEDGPIRYLSALPKISEDTSSSHPPRNFLLIDPIIATGATAITGIKTLLDYGVKPENIKFVSLMIGDKGQQALARLDPERYGGIEVFCIKLGEKMEDNSIINGLGSVIDRQFRTI